MERSKNDIGPPQNLNPRLVEEHKINNLKKTQKEQEKPNKSSSISKRLLKLFRRMNKRKNQRGGIPIAANKKDKKRVANLKKKYAKYVKTAIRETRNLLIEKGVPWLANELFQSDRWNSISQLDDLIGI